jgi:CBS domain-containing protein
MRPVKSRILFEQMVGRGTRKGEKFTDKDHFTVFDCFDGTLLAYFRDSTGITAEEPAPPTRTLEEIVKNVWDNRDREYNVGCLVKRLQRIDKAMAGEALVGLVARAALATDVVDTRAVRDVICAEPLVVHEDVSLREAADLMALGGADLLPVVPRSGVRHVLGVLTRSDLLRVARDRLAHDEVAPPTLRLPTRRRTRTVASGKTAPIVQR